MKITEITVLSNKYGADTLILLTDLPNGCYPYEGNATVEIKVASGAGERYATSNFPDIRIKVVSV